MVFNLLGVGAYGSRDIRGATKTLKIEINSQIRKKYDIQSKELYIRLCRK